MKKINYLLVGLVVAMILLNCTKEDSAISTGSDTGIAGSYARFLVIDDHLFIVDNENIKTFSLDDPSDPLLVDEQQVGERIESLFHRNGSLFVGSGSGLYIYELDSEGIPVYVSDFQYDVFSPFEPCDPVVANDSFAYVTLNTVGSISGCRGRTFEFDLNQLVVFDITDIRNPVVLNEIPLTAPKGVGIDGDLLFVCDDTDGLRVFDIKESPTLTEIAHIDDFTAFDVIPLDGLLLVVGPDNIRQFDYTDVGDIRLLSTIDVK